MKTTFPGWYAKSPEELKALWDSAIIVPDTNILLHLIRHSASVRGQLMGVFERKKDAQGMFSRRSCAAPERR